MKKIVLTLLMVVLATASFAQDKTTSSDKETKKRKTSMRSGKCPALYITTSTGINNNTAITGFSFDVPVSKVVSIEAGVGTGTWATKVYAGAKYYLDPCQRGFAFGAGLAYCTGVHHDRHDLETIYGNTQSIVYDKNPQTNLLFMAYKYWNLGRKYNRFYLELGWSTLLTGGSKITQVTGPPISSKAADDLNSGIQGGPILAVGVSFGLHSH